MDVITYRCWDLSQSLLLKGTLYGCYETVIMQYFGAEWSYSDDVLDDKFGMRNMNIH